MGYDFVVVWDFVVLDVRWICIFYICFFLYMLWKYLIKFIGFRVNC